MAALSKEQVKTILEASGVGERLKTLLAALHEAATTEAQCRWDEVMAGRGSLDLCAGSSLRLLEAEKELSGKKDDQIVALDNHLKRMRELEKVFQALFDAGHKEAPLSALSEAKFHALQAEIWLERAKGR